MNGELIYKYGELAEIKGTVGDDSISLTCERWTCFLDVNGAQTYLSGDHLQPYGLKISGFTGNDFIKVHFDEEIWLMGVHIDSGEGNNQLDLAFPFPNTEGPLYLGNGINHLIIPDTRTNMIVHGISYNKANKITIKSCKDEASKPKLEEYDGQRVYNLVYQNELLLRLANDISDTELAGFAHLGYDYNQAKLHVGALVTKISEDMIEISCESQLF